MSARRSQHWISALVAVGFALKFGAVLWAIDRGFELGDEGYCLMNLNHPQDAPAVFQFYRLVGLFSARFDVVDARLLRLGAELLGSLALLAGVFAWARMRFFASDRALGIPLLLFGLLGALLSTASRSLSYNDATNLFGYSAIGASFYFAALPGRRAQIAAALAAGFCNGLLFGAKFPTALLLPFVAALAASGALRSLPARERIETALLYATGVLLALGLYVAINGGVAPLYEALLLMPEVARSTGYDPLSLLFFYAKGEVVTAIHVAVVALAFGVALLVMRRLFASAPDRALALALAAGASALAFGVRLLHPFFLDPSLVYLSAFLAFALVLLFAIEFGARRGEAGRWSALAPLFALIALPLVEIAGTNVPISERLATHALPLFAALGLLSLDLRERAHYVRLHAVLALVLLALTSVLFAQHHLIAPYGLPQDITQQREPVEGLPGLRVDAATKSFLESVGAAMRAGGFERGDPVLALDFMPGLVFYLGGTSPGFTLYLFDNPRLNCFNVNRLYDAPPYLILGRPMSAAQAACLDAFAFPGDFRELRSVRFPYEAVYEDFGAHDFSHVHLYAPRDR